MCGICGFTVNNDYLTSRREIISKMLDSIHHRGPDDEGIFIDDDVIIGARRLSIIDLTGGHQPIHNEDKSLWIVFNGEIYNFLELREFLKKKGHAFYTRTDTEVIIHLYEEYGTDCIGKLNGMFAFAIWDKERRELLLARDRFGIKPLYYAEFNGQLIFASEIKSILKFPGVQCEIDLIALDQYLTFEYIPAPSSIFKKIKKLPAAHILTYKNKRISITKYWDINFSEKCNPMRESDVKEKLLQILKIVIKRHLISDVPWGIFLSGGLDSSFIVALSNSMSPGKIKTFSIGFKEDSFDESRYIYQIARCFDTEHYHKVFSAKDLIGLLPEAVYFLDEPLGDASYFATFLLSKFTRRNVTVALSGDGGDELFAGYPTYQAHRLINHYRLIPAFFRKKIIDRVILNLPVAMDNFSFDFRAKRFISGVSSSVWERHIYWMGSFNWQDKIELYSDEMKDVIKKEDLDSMVNYFNSIPAADTLNRLQYFDMKTYLQDDLLAKVDRASMAHSLEVRVPYLDNELVEFVFSLPSNSRLHNFRTKYIFKKTASGVLPQNIINREKKGFGIPVASWIKRELKEMILNALNEKKIKKESFFNHHYIKNLMQQHFTHKIDNRKKIWTLFVFELWLDKYLHS